MKSQPLQEIINLFPLGVQKAKKGFGSFLTFDLDDSFHLWIYLCDWLILQNNVRLASSNDSQISKIDHVLASLETEQITGLNEQNGNRVEITFSNDYKIVLEPDLDLYDETSDLFIFYLTKETTVSYSVKRRFYLEC